jgi:outer membrane protein OmpA-like peptidoglycan-associated protein
MCPTVSRTARATVTVALSLAIASACAKPKPATPAPDDLNLQGAAQFVAGDLARQLSPGERTLVIDPLIDRTSGQQTGVSAQVEEAIRPALSQSLKNVTLLPFDADNAGKSRLVMTGTVSTVAPPDKYSVSVSLSDRESGLVVAQSVARFTQSGLDTSPTRFYNDSPSLVRDRSVDGYVRTSETPAGTPADPLYLEQIPTSALLAEALAAYNGGQFEQALVRYNAAASRQDGQQLRTFNGLYLCNVRLNRLDAAEEAFGKIATLGLATNNLAVKLLFRPGSTEFVADPSLSGMYPRWLRQIGRATRTSKVCLNIVGHTSRSGSESVNDRLSLNRATTVRTLLEREAPGLERLSRVSGVGFRQNLVGTGTDDATDAIDRRVVFEVVACGG